MNRQGDHGNVRGAALQGSSTSALTLLSSCWKPFRGRSPPWRSSGRFAELVVADEDCRFGQWFCVEAEHQHQSTSARRVHGGIIDALRAESRSVPSARLSPPMAIRDHDRGVANLCSGHGAESCVLSSRQALLRLCGNGRAEFTSLVFERDGSDAFFELSRLSRLERRGRPLYCGILNACKLSRRYSGDADAGPYDCCRPNPSYHRDGQRHGCR